MEDRPFFDIDGVEHCDEEAALSTLLREEKLFCNGRDYLDIDGSSAGETTVLFVLCNDLFVWGSADAESLPHDEIGNLYKAWEQDKAWGTDKWCCIRRNMKPQKPIEKAMKRAGVWDSVMEALPENPVEKMYRERRANP